MLRPPDHRPPSLPLLKGTLHPGAGTAAAAPRGDRGAPDPTVRGATTAGSSLRRAAPDPPSKRPGTIGDPFSTRCLEELRDPLRQGTSPIPVRGRAALPTLLPGVVEASSSTALEDADRFRTPEGSQLTPFSRRW